MSQPIQSYIPQDLSALAAAPVRPGAQALVDGGTVANVNAPAQTELAVQQQMTGNGQNLKTAVLQSSTNMERTAGTMATEAAGEEYKTKQAINTVTANTLSTQGMAQDLAAQNIALMMAVNKSGEYTAGLGEKMAAVEQGGRNPLDDVAKMITQANSMKAKKA